MNYGFHPEAEAEFFQAIDFYESRCPGLGYDFLIEVHRTIETILSFPKAWPNIENDIRRCLVGRFPYGVIYSQVENIIYVLAVMHLHRNPDHWKDRA